MIKREQLISGLLDIAKIISFLSLVMTVVIKTRILLGLPNGIQNKENTDENKS